MKHSFTISVDGEPVTVSERDDLHNVSVYHSGTTVLWDPLSHSQCSSQCLDSQMRCEAVATVESNLTQQLAQRADSVNSGVLGLSSAEVAALCEVICDDISEPPTHVAAISRGGLVPGVMLSHWWSVPLIPVTWSTRDFVDQQPQQLLPLLKLITNNSDHRILLVDDICDSGFTFGEITNRINDGDLASNRGTVITAALCAKASSRDLVDIAATIVPEDVWVEFPWEQWHSKNTHQQ